MSDRITILASTAFVALGTSSCAWLDEMREPDRTITIVSIIGLVIIWGSVLYHKFVQGGSILGSDDPGQPEGDAEGDNAARGGSSAKTGNSKKSKKRR